MNQPLWTEILPLHFVFSLALQVCDHPPSLCSPIKEPFSPLNSVVSTEPFRGCYVRAQPFDEFPSSNRRYLPPQVSCKLRPFSLVALCLPAPAHCSAVISTRMGGETFWLTGHSVLLNLPKQEDGEFNRVQTASQIRFQPIHPEWLQIA